MQYDAFRRWLPVHRPQGRWTQNSRNTCLADVKGIDRDYGDLDAAYEDDGCASIMHDLKTITHEENVRRINEARARGEKRRFIVSGRGSYTGSLAVYCEFLAYQTRMVRAHQRRSDQMLLLQDDAQPPKGD
jgi:hypothetical protein